MANGIDSFFQGFTQQQLSPQGFVGGQLEAGPGSVSDIESRRKQRLQMALESAKIQAETEGKMQAEAAKYQMENAIPADAQQRLSDFSGGLPYNNASVGKLSEGLFNASQNNLLKQLRVPVGEGKDVINNPYGIIEGKQPINALGQHIGKPEIWPNTAEKLKNADSLSNFEGDLNQFEKKSATIDKGRLTGFINTGLGYAGLNADITNFQTMKDKLILELPKMLAGYTRYNQAEINTLSEGVKKISTPEEFDNFVAGLRNDLEVRKKTLGFGGRTLEGAMQQPAQPQQQTAPPGQHPHDQADADRFKELIKLGNSEDQAYSIMKKEGRGR